MTPTPLADHIPTVSIGSLRLSVCLTTVDVEPTVKTSGQHILPISSHNSSHKHARFQRRQYAPIEIVKTEMKGFGLRAAQDIPKCA